MTKEILGHLGIGDIGGILLWNITNKEFIVIDLLLVFDNPRVYHRIGMGSAGLTEHKGVDEIVHPLKNAYITTRRQSSGLNNSCRVNVNT